MIQTHLLSVQIRWMTLMRILMITIQGEKEKILIVFDDMIADIMTNKEFKAIIKEFLLGAENQTFYLFLLLNLIFLFQKK